MIRDPAVWMASMCRHPYTMEWVYTEQDAVDGTKQHCPNLVPNEVDIALDPSIAESDSIPVTITYAKFQRTHESMLHHWNDYYNEYYHQRNRMATKQYNNTMFPRLIVRYEDIIFHPKEVTKTACHCAGGEMIHANDNDFVYMVDSAKKGIAHGTEKTGYIDAIIKYGSNKHRWEGMTIEDLLYFKQHADAQLMDLFQYKYPK